MTEQLPIPRSKQLVDYLASKLAINTTQLITLQDRLFILLIADEDKLIKYSDKSSDEILIKINELEIQKNSLSDYDQNAQLEEARKKAASAWQNFVQQAGLGNYHPENFSIENQLDLVELVFNKIKQSELQKQSRDRILELQPKVEIPKPIVPITPKLEDAKELSFEHKAEFNNSKLVDDICKHIVSEVEGLNDEQTAKVQGYANNLIQVLQVGFPQKYKIPNHNDMRTRLRILMKETQPYSLIKLFYDKDVMTSDVWHSILEEERERIHKLSDRLFISKKNEELQAHFRELGSPVDSLENIKTTELFNLSRRNDVLKVRARYEFTSILHLITHYKQISEFKVETPTTVELIPTKTACIFNLAASIKLSTQHLQQVNSGFTAKELIGFCKNNKYDELHEHFCTLLETQNYIKHYSSLQSSNKRKDWRFIFMLGAHMLFEKAIDSIFDYHYVGRGFWIDITQKILNQNPEVVQDYSFINDMLPLEITKIMNMEQNNELADDDIFDAYIQLTIKMLELVIPLLFTINFLDLSPEEQDELLRERDRFYPELAEPKLLEPTEVSKDVEPVLEAPKQLHLLNIDIRIGLVKELQDIAQIFLNEVSTESTAEELKAFVTKRNYIELLTEFHNKYSASSELRQLMDIFASNKLMYLRVQTLIGINFQVSTIFHIESQELRNNLIESWNSIVQETLDENPDIPGIKDFDIKSIIICAGEMLAPDPKKLTNRMFDKVISATNKIIQLVIPKLLKADATLTPKEQAKLLRERDRLYPELTPTPELQIESAESNETKTPTQLILEFIEATKLVIDSIKLINGNSTVKEIKATYSDPALSSAFNAFVTMQNSETKEIFINFVNSKLIEPIRAIALMHFELFIEANLILISQKLNISKMFWLDILEKLATEHPQKINANNFDTSFIPTQPPQQGQRKSYKNEVNDSRTFGLYIKMMATVLELAEPKLLELAKELEVERVTPNTELLSKKNITAEVSTAETSDSINTYPADYYQIQKEEFDLKNMIILDRLKRESKEKAAELGTASEKEFYQNRIDQIKVLLDDNKFKDGEIDILLRLLEKGENEIKRPHLLQIAALIKDWNKNYSWRDGQIVKTDTSDSDFPKYITKPNLKSILESYHRDNSPVIPSNSVSIIPKPEPKPKPEVSITKLKERFPVKTEEQEFQEELTKLKAEIERIEGLVEGVDWEGIESIYEMIFLRINGMNILFDILKDNGKNERYDVEIFYDVYTLTNKNRAKIHEFINDFAFVDTNTLKRNKEYKIFNQNLLSQPGYSDDARNYSFRSLIYWILEYRAFTVSFVQNLKKTGLRSILRLYDIKLKLEKINIDKLPTQSIVIGTETVSEILDARRLLLLLRKVMYDKSLQNISDEDRFIDFPVITEILDSPNFTLIFNKYLARDNFGITLEQLLKIRDIASLKGFYLSHKDKVEDNIKVLKMSILLKMAIIYAKYDDLQAEFDFYSARPFIKPMSSEEEVTIGLKNLKETEETVEEPTTSELLANY